eukprot:6062143-Amphidinium_carterae.1
MKLRMNDPPSSVQSPIVLEVETREPAFIMIYAEKPIQESDLRGLRWPLSGCAFACCSMRNSSTHTRSSQSVAAKHAQHKLYQQTSRRAIH